MKNLLLYVFIFPYAIENKCKLIIKKFSMLIQNVKYSQIRSACFITISGLCVSIHPFVQAQDAGALQRQLQQQIEREAPQAPISSEKPVEKKQIDPNAQKIQIKSFTFKGNQLISQTELEALSKQWTDRDISFSDLKDLTAAIQDLYAKKNRIAQANVPPQETKNKSVLIEINEGKLGAVIIQPMIAGQQTRFSEGMAQLYFSKAADGTQYIDTQRIERAMTLLNELPGVAATGEFEPGTRVGDTDFRVKLADGPFVNGLVAVSNYGSPSTGVGQLIGNLSLNNLSGIGDQVTLDAIQSWGSTYGQIGYSLPVGYDGWRVGAQASYLNYQTIDDWSTIQTSGTASTYGLNATYPLIRSNGEAMNLRFGLEKRTYSNTQSGQNINSHQVNALSAGVNGNISDSAKSVINYSLTATYGKLDINNLSQAAQDLAGPGTTGPYAKLAFNLARNQDVTSLPATNWLVSVYGQLANTNLNSSEQLYMGGAYGVRAYPVAQGGGSQGAILTNELQHKLNKNWQLGGFVDVGYVQQYVNLYPNWQGLTHANNTYLLAALGPTIKYTINNITVNAALAMRIGDNPLYTSSGQQLNGDNAYRLYQGWVKASYAF